MIGLKEKIPLLQKIVCSSRRLSTCRSQIRACSIPILMRSSRRRERQFREDEVEVEKGGLLGLGGVFRIELGFGVFSCQYGYSCVIESE